LIFILGGTKSGKSSFASSLAEEREELGLVSYLATAEAGDDEMAERIRRHKADRPAAWITVEEALKPASYFRKLSSGDPEDSPATVILDCITLWLTNLLMPLGEKPDRRDALELGRKEVTTLLHAVSAWEKGIGETRKKPGRQALIVSNQVETGLISPWPLGRIFQDLAGLTHQNLAAEADEVYLMQAGLPQKLK
jgi:adenosylcobinamide kinase/adenosylcobinamide-phosphate guanylyltransferase